MRKYKVFKGDKQITEFQTFKDLRKGDDLILPTIDPDEYGTDQTVYPIIGLAYTPHSDYTHIQIG